MLNAQEKFFIDLASRQSFGIFFASSRWRLCGDFFVIGAVSLTENAPCCFKGQTAVSVVSTNPALGGIFS